MRKKVKLSDKCGKSKIVGQLSKKKDGLLIKDRIVNLGKKELMQSTNLINENTTIYIFFASSSNFTHLSHFTRAILTCLQSNVHQRIN